MTREEAFSRLKRHELDLNRLGVEHLYLFGSTVRNEACEDFDVDLFFDHPEGLLGLFQSMDVKEAALDFSIVKPTSWPAAACTRR